MEVEESVPSALSENARGVDPMKPLLVVYGQVQGTKKGFPEPAAFPAVPPPLAAFPLAPFPPPPPAVPVAL
jgi:hypothetical protein